MFNTTIVENALDGIVGVRNPNNPDYAIIDSANQLSSSGYFVNDIALAKIEYLKEAQDYEAITDEGFNDLIRTLRKSAISSVCNQVFNTEDFRDRNAFYRHANNNVDAEAFIAFYESKGWMIGKNKMKDWKQAIITWEKRQYKKPTMSKIDSQINEYLKGKEYL